MASDIDASCENDPNFAVICAFLEKFGPQCGLPSLDILELQAMLENTDEVPPLLLNLMLKVLRRVKKSVKNDKWEKSLVAVCHRYNTQDAWEIERFGYKKAKLTAKVRILKELLEMQFDYHMKFKNDINKISADDLRSQPLGRDKTGQNYWFQEDDNYQIRVYKEDLDEETWTLIAKDRGSLVSLISDLNEGDYKISSDSAVNEDSNSLSEKPVIDTGQKDEDSAKPENSSETKDSTKTDDSTNTKSDQKESKQEELEQKPALRIRSLSDLMENGGKRPNIEDESSIEKTKFLKVELTKLVTTEIVGPKLVFKGEGSGAENESCPENYFEVNPIVGETIEEQPIYFYGEGNGNDCETGNEDNVTKDIENKSKDENDSISSNIGVNKDIIDNLKEVPCKLDDVETNSKTDNNSSKSLNVDESTSQSSIEEVATSPVDASTKNTFFFGSPVKNSISSALTMGFGKTYKKSEDAVKSPLSESDNITERDKDVIVDESSLEDNKSDLPVAVNHNKADENEILVNDVNDSPKSTVINEDSTISPSKKEDVDNVTENIDANKIPVIEEPFIKKVAYVCGKGDLKDEQINEKDSDALASQESAKSKEDSDSPLVTADLTDKIESTVSPELSEPVGSNTTNTLNEEHKSDKQEIGGPAAPKQSLRLIRSKKVANTIANKTDSSTVTASNEKESAPEVVYVKGRRNRLKKKDSDEIAAPVAVNKKPKLITRPTTEQEESTKSATDTTNTDPKPNNGKSSVASTNSSRVSSPISVADSVITLSESIESTDVRLPEKDPLAESEQEEQPKAVNLQTLSFDFNESSNPPPIPVIPSTRNLRTLRKRGRAASPETNRVDISEEKRRKIKGKRQIDVQLRKSIEQQKEQQVSSSDEVSVSIAKSKKSSIKKKKHSPKNKKIPATITISDDDSTSTPTPVKVIPVPKPKRVIVRHPENKNKRLLAGMDLSEITGVRASRRLAQIKIKEQVQVEPKKSTQKIIKEEKGIIKKKKHEKEPVVDKKKLEKKIKEDSPEVEIVQESKKKKKKSKAPSKIFDEHRPWQSSSGSSEEEKEEVEEEEEVIEEYEPPLEFKSDHEFSPESDVGSQDEEYQPRKRARTAKIKQPEEPGEAVEEEEDFPCQKCGKSDHPEMVLLCDKCDNGWHCSCLRPPLLSIPEGDWFCPPCQHIKLVENLHAKLVEFDKKLTKKSLEDRRKERIAYVGISLNNVLPTREKDHRKKRRRHSEDGTESSSDDRSDSTGSETDESDSDEPIYQLRQRRQAKSYKFNEYDELIKSAIQDDLDGDHRGTDAVPMKKTRGKDMSTIVKAEELDRKERELQMRKEQGIQDEISEEKSEEKIEEKTEETPPTEITEENVEEKPKEESDEEVIKPPVKNKKKKTNFKSLDFSSEDDDEKDEDFKGSSSSSEEDLEEESESEDYEVGRRGKSLRPLRRSTRARVARFDTDFINDDDDDVPKKKKKIRYFSDSDSSESEENWGKKKKKSSFGKKKKKKKKKKGGILDELSDLERGIKKRPKIKYGGLTSSDDDDFGRGRRTRGKKTTYIDTLGSDSDDERRRRDRLGIVSDDDNDEDFVANDEEEKDSEVEPPIDNNDNEDNEENDDNDEDDEDNAEEKKNEAERKPFVPKIYIKKPLILKEIEKPKEKEVKKKQEDEKIGENTETTRNKAEESIPKTNGEEEKTKIEEEKTKREEEKLEKIKMLEKLKEALERSKAAKEASAIKTDGVNYPFTKPPENEINANEVINNNQSAEERENAMLKNLSHIENEKKKRKAIDGEGDNFNELELAQQGKRAANLLHEPIISNVTNMIRNDDSNDELSEPPMGVALPLFEELSQKSGDDSSKKKRGRGKSKKSLEETLANLSTKKSVPDVDCNIEIAAPPQPFSQAAPTPSVITRMLQTKPGQTTTYPIGSIRPKQFATMLDDDDDDSPPPPPQPHPKPKDGSPGLGLPTYPPPGGPRPPPVGLPYRSMYQNMNRFPPGMLPPHQIRGPPTLPPAPGMLPPPHLYQPHRFVDPSPSGGGPINMSESNPSIMAPHRSGSPGSKAEPQNYSRSTPPSRFPPVSVATSVPGSPQRSVHMMSHLPPPRPVYPAPNQHPPPIPQSQPPPPPPAGYYGSYHPPAEPLPPHEDTTPPYTHPPPTYEEEFQGEEDHNSSDNPEPQHRSEEESGGEFGGLVSYFSSQRDDELDS